MSWNYRVFRKRFPSGEEALSIRSTHYSDAGEVKCWSSEPADPYGDDLESLRWDLEAMLRALDKPVIDEEEGR